MSANKREGAAMQKRILVGLSFGLIAACGGAITAYMETRENGEPDIVAQCSSNGFGQGKCIFQNRGTGSGSICVYSAIGRNWNPNDPSLYEDKGGQDGKIPVGIISQPICSGRIAGGDVVERSILGYAPAVYDAVTRTEAGVSVSPAEFCLPRGFERVISYSSWTDACTVKTTPDVTALLELTKTKSK
ncbi:MAG: hypothetical protein K1X51_06460 [Rhodospirillaceae bacterium]|nr:hypothetical protein [Rhodospirillaceae bacterium]